MPIKTLTPPPNTFWIGSAHAFDLHEVYINFQSPAAWTLSRVPQKAELFVTADSRYKLWVNGQFVSRGPARCYPQHQSVDRLDIAPFLKAGPNQITIQVYQPGYSHFSYVHRGMAGLLAWLLCDDQVELVSDATWHVQRDPTYADQVPRVSIYGTGVEMRDLRHASGITEQARIVAQPTDAPWLSLTERNVAHLVERSITPARVEIRRGPCADDRPTDPHAALCAGWTEASAAQIQTTPTDRYEFDLLPHQSIYWLFDLGRDYTCQGWAEIANTDASNTDASNTCALNIGGQTLSIGYFEKFRDGALVMPDPETYCRVRITDQTILGAGEQLVEGFTLRGGRYVLFQLSNPTDTLTTISAKLNIRVAQYPLEITKPIQTTDPQLQQIAKLCEETIHACLQETFVDCVWRESSQWLGDALPQALSMWSMSDDVRPMLAVIEMAAQGAYPDGILPSIIPGEVHAYTIPRYNMMWIELLAFATDVTGDSTLSKRLWPTVQSVIAALDRHQTDAGLIMNPPGRRLYIDWSPSSQNQPHAVYNLHFVLALNVAAKLADQLSMAADAAAWRDRAAALMAASRETFLVGDRWYDDVERSTFSALAASLAILSGAADDDEIPALLDAIAARSLDPSDEHDADKMVLASPFMHHYIFMALRKHKRFDDALSIMRLRWGRWVEQGYPTTWENWDVDFPDGSQCHSFSAHPRYHMAEILRVHSGG